MVNLWKKVRNHTRLIADASLFVEDVPVGKFEFSFESFLTANGVEEAIPFIRVFDGGKDAAVVKGFFVGSWLCERFVREVDDGGDKLVNDSFVVGLFSNRETRPREPAAPVLFDVDCWALSCNFWSSERCDSSRDVCWYDVFGTKSFESSRISTSFVSLREEW